LQNANKKKGKSNNDPKGTEQGNKSTNKKNNRKKPAWMTKEPSPEEINKPKRVNDKEYWWCKKHKSWGRHKTQDCEGKGINKSENSQASNAQKTNNSADKKLKLSAALSTVFEGDDE